MRSLLKLKGKTVAERKAEAEAAEEAKIAMQEGLLRRYCGANFEPILDTQAMPWTALCSVPQFMMFYFPEASKMMIHNQIC